MSRRASVSNLACFFTKLLTESEEHESTNCCSRLDETSQETTMETKSVLEVIKLLIFYTPARHFLIKLMPVDVTEKKSLVKLPDFRNPDL